MKQSNNWEESTPRTFRVRAEKIPTHGSKFQEALSKEWLTSLLVEQARDLSWTAAQDTTLHVDIRPENGKILLQAQGHLLLSHPCVRCLKNIAFEVALDFKCLLTQEKAQDEDLEEDFEWHADQIDLGQIADENVCYFEGGIIDLSMLLREQLFLELPSYPSCDHELAGEQEECAFVLSAQTQQWVDPRLAPLIDMRERFANSAIDKNTKKS